MVILINEVLSAARAAAIVSVLSDERLFESGDRTAGALAKAGKNNLQGISGKPEIDGVISKVRAAIDAHTDFARHALPATLGRMIVSRYDIGMGYDTHFDDAVIAGVRTDLSFTVFLSDPGTYSGGELEVFGPSGSQLVKLPAGSAVLYPSDTLHRVCPVTSGTRFAAVGWVQSQVRSSEQRSILAELAAVADALPEGGGAAELAIKHVGNRLLRLWTDA